MLLFWIGFNVFVLAMLALDLGVFNRRAHVVKVREAAIWSIVWISLAAIFAVIIYFWHGRAPTLEFVTGYVVELSLSVDNLFVFLVIFRYFRVPAEHQHKVLFWGIIGALIMRAIFIFAGVSLIRRFEWITYIFGAFLVYSGVKLFRQEETEVHPESNPVLRLFRKVMPVTKEFQGDRFFVRRQGLFATPLLIVLLLVETTDILFAADSVPAILAITVDAFIVYTSNVFAILGLRSMYFALAGLIERFHYLHYGLSVVLIFIGAKMLVAHYYKVPIGLALGFVVAVLLGSVVASLVRPKEEHAAP
ncbi:MAG: TerC family protein [Acidobacteriales bacterium]|nr:TerC family protein [Terriglobales bacterium]